ncbi:hypothetical protein Tco_0612159 [Tanacetum coccineum]
MSQEEIQQAAREEAWVPKADRVKISTTNMRIDRTMTQKEETYQVVLDIIKNTTFYKAFLASADLIWEDFSYQIDNSQLKKALPSGLYTIKDDDVLSQMKFFRIGEDFQEYGPAIPKTMLTKGIKQTETYQTIIKYSTGLIPLKKSTGKGSQGQKSAITPKPASVEVSDESEPEPTRRKSGSKRMSKKKVSISANDNIIPEPDVALELGKSMSLDEATEEEEARQVHATHEWIATESDPKPARRRPSEEESEYYEEETVDKEIEWLTTDEKEEKKDNDEDDRSIDNEKNDDDEETNDEFVHGDEYVHDNVDNEMKDAEVIDTKRDDQKTTDAEKAEVEKIEEVKGENKKSELPPTSSSLFVSFRFGNQFLGHSLDIYLIRTLKDTIDAKINSLLDIQIQQEVPHIQSPSILSVYVSVILEPTILLPIPEIPIVTSEITHPPLYSVSTITPVLQQTSTPIPTPPITTEAPPITIVLDPLHAIAQRVYVLEKDVQELRQVDYSTVLAESIRSHVPPAVKEYLRSSLGDALQKVLRKHTEELIKQSSQKDVSEIR